MDPVTGATAAPVGYGDDTPPEELPPLPPEDLPPLPPGAVEFPPPPIAQPHEGENRRAVKDAASQLDAASREAANAMREIERR